MKLISVAEVTREEPFCSSLESESAREILYLDSLEVDEIVQSEEDCPIRAATWNDKLIQAAMRKDSKGDGEFGKLRTPVRVESGTVLDSQGGGSTTAAERPQERQHMLIRQALCELSPYITYEDKTLFTCSADVKELYNAVIAHGRRSPRGQDVDNSPIVVSYDKFFVSLREIANSMMPCGVMKNIVMEIGIESIMLRKDRKLKKIVMPLRVMFLLEDLKMNEKDLEKHFNRATSHLDRKDTVSVLLHVSFL
ncbi:hypothetical protein ACQ4PT_041882 [Festuca glaucescens]